MTRIVCFLVFSAAVLSGCGDAPTPADGDVVADVIATGDPETYGDTAAAPTAAPAAYHFLAAAGDTAVSLNGLERAIGHRVRTDFGRLRTILAQRGAKATARAETLAVLLAAPMPAIVLARDGATEADPKNGRFLVVVGREGEGVRVIDPLAGNRVVPEAELKRRYLGVDLRLDAPAPRPAIGAPNFRLDEVVRDFGRVASGEIIRHSFRLRNTGDRPLHVTGVDTSCGCAAAMVSKAAAEPSPALLARVKADRETKDGDVVEQKDAGGVIPPGEEAWISAYVNTLFRSGNMEFRVVVRSNDPEEPQVLLWLRGIVERVFEYDPVILWFKDVPAARGEVAHLWVRHQAARAFTISELKSSVGHIEATLDPGAPRERTVAPDTAGAVAPDGTVLPPAKMSYPAAAGWQAIRVRLKPGAPVGPIAARVTFRCEGTPLEVYVSGAVVGNLKIEPASFHFGRLKPGKARSAMVIVTSTDPAFRVTGVKTDRPELTAEVEAEGPGASRVRLMLAKGWASYPRGSVVLETNDPLQPTVKVLFFGFVVR